MKELNFNYQSMLEKVNEASNEYNRNWARDVDNLKNLIKIHQGIEVAQKKKIIELNQKIKTLETNPNSYKKQKKNNFTYLSISNNSGFTYKSIKENLGYLPFKIVEIGNEEDNLSVDFYQDELETEKCISCYERPKDLENKFTCGHDNMFCLPCLENMIQLNFTTKKKNSAPCTVCKNGEISLDAKKRKKLK